jgi:hypothetical protein
VFLVVVYLGGYRKVSGVSKVAFGFPHLVSCLPKSFLGLILVDEKRKTLTTLRDASVVVQDEELVGIVFPIIFPESEIRVI